MYHSACIDASNPSRPVLEVDAVLREGDADDGPILLPWADFVVMVGKETADACRPGFEAAGRIVGHLDVAHLAFPMWTAGDVILR